MTSKMDGSRKMRALARNLSKMRRVREYLIPLMDEPQSENILHPRVAFGMLGKSLRRLRGTSSGSTITIDAAEFDKLIQENDSYEAAQPPLPPRLFFRYTDGWSVDPKNPELFLYRMEQVKGAVRLLMDHVSSNVDVKHLKLLCLGDCHCHVQQGPVGERGGFPRRVPCGREELATAKPMTAVTIQHVSQFLRRETMKHQRKKTNFFFLFMAGGKNDESSARPSRHRYAGRGRCGHSEAHEIWVDVVL